MKKRFWTADTRSVFILQHKWKFAIRFLGKNTNKQKTIYTTKKYGSTCFNTYLRSDKTIIIADQLFDNSTYCWSSDKNLQDIAFTNICTTRVTENQVTSDGRLSRKTKNTKMNSWHKNSFEILDLGKSWKLLKGDSFRQAIYW